MKYRIALLRSDEGYSVSVPGLPGCCSQGATEQEAVQNIRVAIQEYLAVRELLQGTTIIRKGNRVRSPLTHRGP